MEYLLLIIGLVFLVVSGELLVRGAAGIALKSDIPPIIVGLTVVSIGTSAPELFASVNAALSGNPGLAIGNVLGSNIANLGLVLAITAMIYPIPVPNTMLRFDWPVMMIASIAFLLAILNLNIAMWEGIIMLLLLTAFIFILIRKARKEKKAAVLSDVEELNAFQSKPFSLLAGLIIIGCVGLYFGSGWFVDGASQIAKNFGVSNHIVGVTVVAFGTSVPELAASIIAAFRKQTDISIGNLIGSNIFNIFAVLGTTAVITPLEVDAVVLNKDIWWMLGISMLVLPMMLIGKDGINRYKGFIFLLAYLAYIYSVLA
ncbi:MAG: calcium/sodium antiporter [Flavobacteriales bacterium]|nr:calcium/sodium antiporter [Flavobacteriales bacterium]MDG1766384.1 calcium/sodium antiporter [Flavobacteriales bacterium]